ncbi:MAG TPA: phage baseplate assembly protein V [Allosphingosinicella sp.]|nr:phage baseplate assembly protein V [Allosphingosinicella sp.]
MDGTPSQASGTGEQRRRLYGKFAGTVSDNMDPLRLGRLQAFVPEVLGEVATGWAKPCVPYAGPTSGFFSLPPVTAGVWIEFEAGDVSRPIWTGCFWGAGELPMKPPGAPSQPTTHIWRTTLGLSAVLDDNAQTMTLTDATGLNSVEISAMTGTVTVKAAAQIVLAAGVVLKAGGNSATHPGVLGDQLLSQLTQLVTMFNTHVHGSGVGPTSPPVVPLSPPSPGLLSTKVMLE